MLNEHNQVTHMTLRRSMTLERRLESDKNFKLEYKKFIKEYIEFDHMQLLQNVTPKDRRFYVHTSLYIRKVVQLQSYVSYLTRQ